MLYGWGPESGVLIHPAGDPATSQVWKLLLCLYNINTPILRRAFKKALFLPGTLLYTSALTATVLQLLDYTGVLIRCWAKCLGFFFFFWFISFNSSNNPMRLVLLLFPVYGWQRLERTWWVRSYRLELEEPEFEARPSVSRACSCNYSFHEPDKSMEQVYI